MSRVCEGQLETNKFTYFLNTKAKFLGLFFKKIVSQTMFVGADEESVIDAILALSGRLWFWCGFCFVFLLCDLCPPCVHHATMVENSAGSFFVGLPGSFNFVANKKRTLWRLSSCFPSASLVTTRSGNSQKKILLASIEEGKEFQGKQTKRR